MRILNLRRSLACAVVAGALGLPVGDAQAVVYSSNFDPPNFFGTATFDVSQGCLDAGPGSVSPGTPASCTVSWLGATVTFNDPFNPTTFTYHPDFLPSSGVVNDIWVQGGELAGLNSAAIGAVLLVDQDNPDFDGPWWIQFSFLPPDDDILSVLDGPPSSGQFGLGVVYLYTGGCSNPDVGEVICIRNNDPSEVAQVENFTRVAQVPEPGTLALSLVALGSAWFARRRRNVAV